ncbi:MAG: hypothetical protein ATN36_00225 [Epulopiscium sp. Nele67-Bin005]|nr:MAG: hypothetical protein ATN36_00225 [Epulopiscium sp. Nele67-Bin005]
MMSSMFSGVSGLKVHQTKMDVIGNNIANVNTTGFKADRVTFSDVFYTTMQSGTGASDATGRGGLNPMQVGLGASVSSIDTLMTTGSTQRTDNPFDVMIQGDGMLIVSDASGTYFTRAGALRIDVEGNLVIPNGMKVQGWGVNEETGLIERGVVQDLVLSSPSNLTTQPEITTDVQISGNLALSDSILADDTPEDPTDNPVAAIPTQIKFYDSLGNYWSMTLTFQATEIIEGTQTTWTAGFPSDDSGTGYYVELTNQNGETVVVDPPPSIEPSTFSFDSTGSFIGVDGALAYDPTDLSSGQLVISGLSIPGSSAVVGLDGAVTVDVSQLTQYTANTNLTASLGSLEGTGAGKSAGDMVGFDIGTDGKITAYYNNGDTKLLGQVVMAIFENPAGMEKVGDTLFAATNNSGEFDGIGTDALLQTGVLEMSNVDLSSEFTEMIITQRGFQANSKIITTSDELLQELVNLKR